MCLYSLREKTVADLQLKFDKTKARGLVLYDVPAFWVLPGAITLWWSVITFYQVNAIYHQLFSNQYVWDMSLRLQNEFSDQIKTQIFAFFFFLMEKRSGLFFLKFFLQNYKPYTTRGLDWISLNVHSFHLVNIFISPLSPVWHDFESYEPTHMGSPLIWFWVRSAHSLPGSYSSLF